MNVVVDVCAPIICLGGKYTQLRFPLAFVVLCRKLVCSMAFTFKCSLDVEYRGMRSGVSSKTNNPWLSLLFEDEEQSQLNVSVPSEMIGDVYGMQLHKGDRCRITMVASARADGNSYLMLRDLVIDEDDGMEY